MGACWNCNRRRWDETHVVRGAWCVKYRRCGLAVRGGLDWNLSLLSRWTQGSLRWRSVDQVACCRCQTTVKTTRLVTILVSALWLAGCASRNQTATTPTASAPRTSAPALFQTIVIKATNQLVYVDGEVKRPDRFVWTPGLTLTNAIALAGGFTDFASKARLEIRRSRDGTVELYNYFRIRNDSTNDPALKPNDQVYVSGH